MQAQQQQIQYPTNLQCRAIQTVVVTQAELVHHMQAKVAIKPHQQQHHQQMLQTPVAIQIQAVWAM
jgi:hypothetical protein